MTKEVSLYRALSKLGYASRNRAVEMITSGEIRVNGIPCFDPDHLVSLHTTRLHHGATLIVREELSVVVLYKPKSVITSRKDEQGRQTVYSLLPPKLHRLHCVGRLDFATSGLLILTNNTLLSAWLTDPGNGIPRVYLVTVRGMMTEDKVQQMLDGIADKGQVLKPETVVIRKSSRRESHMVITLTGGKNREIRRLCSSLGNEVTRLKRVSYGLLTLDNLSPGEYRLLSRREVCRVFPGVHAVL